MSFEQDLIPYSSTKGMDAMEPDYFFAPDPQPIYAPSSESFDQEVDNDKEVEDLELSFKQFDDFFATYCHTIPTVPTPSAVTYSTESGYDVSSSQYSGDFTLSDYSLPSEIESRGSADDQSYGTNASIYPTAFPAFPNSLPAILPHVPTEDIQAQEEYDTVPLSAAVHVVPSEAPEPVRPFKCPLCPFSSKRNYNLSTHIETHFKSKRFKCHTCGCSFTRKHDRKRHRESAHGVQKSSASSVSGISKRSVDPMPDRRDLSNRCIAVKGDPTPMLSTYPDFDAAPEEITAWLVATAWPAGPV